MELQFRSDELNYDLLMIGSRINQQGHSYPAEITIYGDHLVLRCTKSNVILRNPKAKRNVSLEPYVSYDTFEDLVSGFLEVSQTVQKFFVCNEHVQDSHKGMF